MKTKKKVAPLIISKRLSFREITEEDTAFIVKLRSDPDVYRFFLSPKEITAKDHLHWYFNHYVFDENRVDWVAFSKTGDPVGVFGVKRLNGYSRDAEISYILSPEMYGNGYASEAVERLIVFCREEWNCNVVFAEIHQDNLPSIRFAERLRFIEVARNGYFLRFERKI